MGAFSKEFWITIAVCVPVILWTAYVAQSRGGELFVPMFQVAILVVGGVVIWRLGGRILEAVTKIIEFTRTWDRDDRTEAQHEPQYQTEGGTLELRQPTSDARVSSDVFCIHCGYGIPANAAFCRHCGKKQQSDRRRRKKS
jgi:hypothetical protein